METSGVRHVLAYTGEEKYQMLELNRRLETYLNHVKLLEEENHLLWGEIQALRRSQDSGGQRKAQVEALSRARREVQISWREKDCVELEICNLLEEVEELNALRQKERAAQAEAKRRLEESRKMLEDERRMQIWLREKAAHLERELSIQVKVHEEDMAALKSSLSISKPVLTAPQHSQTLKLQGLAEEYSQKAAQAWREASGTYQKQVEKLEESLKQSRAYMDQISQEKKESHLQLQDLAKELENMKVKREFLEKNMAKQRDSQNKEHQHFQAHIETLEAEKVDIEEQISELMVDRRNLLQMKMSLGIEVATYRALLDNENLRANKQSSAKKTLTVLEGITKTHGTYPGTQTHPGISSCLLSSPLSMTSRSITSKPSLMTQAPSWPLTRSTKQETPKKPDEEGILINKKTTNLQSSPATLAKPSTRAGPQFHYEPNDAHKDASYAAEDKPDSILSPSVKEDVIEALESGIGSQQVLSCSNETEVITSQTPDKEVSSSLHMDDAKGSEDGDEEDTEVSAEMAKISHAPMSAWEESDTAIADERDVVSELELESENITENSTHEFRLDARQPEIKEFGKNTNTLLPSLSADVFSPDEETSEMITWTDVNESVIHFVEEESLKSSPEIERESVEGTKEVEGTGTEVLKGQDFDSEEYEEKNEDREMEQRKEEEEINGTEQQSLIMEVTAVTDNNEKEVETIINNSTQEFRLDAGPTEFNQPGENIITLAPSLTEDTPLSAHTFSLDEETSEILTWADVKDYAIHFAEEESLKSAPETERESVEGIKEVDNTLTEVFKSHYFDSEEHEEKNEDREVEKRKEEEETNSTEQQSLIMEATTVMDNNEKEVEAIIINSTQEFRLDAGLKEFNQPSENTITLAPSLTEDTPLSAHTFSPDEETSEILDVKETANHFAEEESLKSAPGTEREFDSTLTEVLKGQDFDSEEHEEKSEDREVEQRKEEEGTIGTEQEKLIMEATAVMDNNEEEVEAIIINRSQEFSLGAGFTEFNQPSENTITLAPSLTEETALSAHTFSPDEETSEIPTWADVKENVINFVEEESLTSTLEIERESVEGTKEESTGTEVFKKHDFDPEEHEEKNEDREMEQEWAISTEQQSLVMEVTAVMDKDEKEVEAIINNSTQEFRLDAGPMEINQSGEKTITLAPSLTEDTPLSGRTFSPDEESSEILTWADEEESVIRFFEEESLKSSPEIERASVEGTKEVEGTGTEVFKSHDFDTKEHEEKNEDREVEQTKEEEEINSTEQQSLIMEATAVMDNNEKEVEAIIINSTQEFRLDAGLTEYKQPGEKTIPLAPSLSEEMALSAHTFSLDEETSEIPTWADVKENIIHSAEEESLKSAPETETKSVEGTKEESTGTEVFKNHDFDSEEHEEKNEDREVEQRKEEEEINSTEQQSLVMEVTAVMDNNEKEVEAIIINRSQEFRLDAGFTEFNQPIENTITLAPSLTEEMALSAHTFSHDEKTSEILDVKENIIRFVGEESLKSAPEIERESVEGTEDEETSEIPTWADEEESVIHFVEEESLKSAPEIERESVQWTKEVEGTGTEVFKSHDFDTKEHEEKNEDREVEQRREVEEINSTEQQSLVMEVTAVMDNNEKEVEAIIINSTQEFYLDAGLKEFNPPGENTVPLAPSLTEEMALSAHTFSPDEETSEIPTWADVKENIIHSAEEESLKSAPETETESVEGTKEESTGTEVFKNHDFDPEEHEEKNEDREMEQRKEEEWAIGTEQQSLVMEVTAVMDKDEKEVEAIINNSAQEFRLDAGPKEINQSGEKTITLAPSLTEDTPLSAHTFSPHEETSEILDVKENVIRFVEEESLKTALEIERESVEQTTEVDYTLTEVLKDHEFDTKEHEEKNEDREVEQRKENTITLAPSLTEDTPLSAHTFSPDEETSEILTWADVKENVIHFVEEESLKSTPDIERESMETIEEVQENPEAELPGTDVLKGQDFEEPEEKYQTDSEAEDRQSTGIKKEELIEEVNAVMDNNEIEAKTQSPSVLQGDLDRISEYAEQKGMDTYGRNRQLDEYHAEEEHGQSEDESLNISASWRTDPGEADSYAQENTLADTRPLIHYKSEEETDADTKMSHLGMTETNDSEGEGEKQEGDGHWSQKLAKRFDTMEDLSEEPEMCNVDDVVTCGSVHTVIEGYEVEVSEEYVQPVSEGLLQRESDDTDHGLMDAALVNHPHSELINSTEESSHGEEETMKENTLLVEKQEESSDFQDWSEGFPSDAREVIEILSTEQSYSSKDDITKDNVENWESTEINPEQEVKARFAYIPLVADTPVAEPPQEQTIEELTFETAMIKEQACPKDEDEQSNLSLLTHADLTDSFSQRSDSYTADSEQEVFNSSDDESPNASRCSRTLPHPDVPNQQGDWTTTSGGVLEKDSGSFTGILKEELRVGLVQDTQEYPQTEESETVRSQNKEEKQCTGSSGVAENAGSLLQTHEHDDVECASHSILSTVQEHGVLKTVNKGEADVFQGEDLNEESQTREKENDPHSFFSSGIKEGIWSTRQFEMAATFDPLDQTETEKDSHPNQSMVFGEGWRDLESLPSTNGKPENETGISLAQSVLEEREDQKMPQARKLQCRDVRDEVVEAVHSGDSTDDGDSWSSGEE